MVVLYRQEVGTKSRRDVTRGVNLWGTLTLALLAWYLFLLSH